MYLLQVKKRSLIAYRSSDRHITQLLVCSFFFTPLLNLFAVFASREQVAIKVKFIETNSTEWRKKLHFLRKKFGWYGLTKLIPFARHPVSHKFTFQPRRANRRKCTNRWKCKKKNEQEISTCFQICGVNNRDCCLGWQFWTVVKTFGVNTPLSRWHLAATVKCRI